MHWNSAATLDDTLASLRAQTCQDFEHIFVDGGSTDGTLDMLAAYPGNKRILRDVGGGISRAMNQGIEAARGAIVAHLHADDYYATPDVLERVGRCFDSSGAGWVVGRIQVLHEGRLLPQYPQRRFSYRAYAAGHASIPHPAVFVRREWFARAGLFDTSLRYAMDIDLWLRLAALAPPAMLDDTLAIFREHAGSVSSSNKLQARREEFAVRRRYLARAPLAFAVYCLRYLKRMHALRRTTTA
ncbi:glycosyltransferase [Massilia sp. Dwa41.01b]|nr:glycosyltransferase [Massilia sp. Dwa41.01b]